MGKASQAKKAARLARESGQVEQKPKRRLAFPLAVAAAVVVGVLVIVIARQPADTPNLTIDPTTLTTDSTVVPGESTTSSVVPTDSTATSSAVPTTAAGQ